MAGHLLSLTDIALSFGGTPLLTAASLEVEPGARIALVGRNGSGKSTLLKIAAGAIEADTGERFIHPGVTVRYLPQEPDFGDAETAGDYVRLNLDHDEDAHRAARMLEAFGISEDARLSACSGGEAKRIAIAAALASAPDILLLDEPTNHLDLPAIALLEEKLGCLNAALVLISHDRRFLETLTTKTVWIDRGVTRAIDQGFKDFEAWRDKTLEEEEAALHKLGRKIVAEEHWLRYGVTARRKRNVRRLGELHAMRKELRETRRPAGSVNFTAAETTRSGKNVIIAENISKSYSGAPIVKDFSITVARGERLGFVAPNGAGKTTLLKMLTGALEPDEGSVTLGARIDLISLDQRRETLKPEMRLADAITDERGDWVDVGGARKHVATYLQDFLFAPEQFRAPVSSLSGGERSRLALAAALAKPSNLLALDEPTNDLDLETLDLLEELLADYKGTLLLISHDRSFLDHIATAIITTDPEKPGRWRRYPGGYDDMLVQRGAAPGAEKTKTPALAKKAAAATPRQRPATQSKLSYKEKYALETLPGKITELQEKIAGLKTRLADAGFYDRDPEGFNRSASDLEAAETALAEAENQWLELEIKREGLDA